MRILGALLILFFASVQYAQAQESYTFESVSISLDHKPGFIDLYVDEDKGRILAVLPPAVSDGLSIRFIYSSGLTGGLGSNPIGLDRGNADSGVIVRFRKIGNRVVAEQENWRYRASSENPREQQAVAQSFATSFLWATEILSTDDQGQLLIDLSGFLLRDQLDVASALKHGEDAHAYNLDAERSFPDTQNALVFPDNVELDAFLTFSTARPNAQTRATAPDARSITLSSHHSFVRLPDGGYRTRKFDQRTANIGMGFYDFSSELGAPIVQRLSRRFRLERVDPSLTSGSVKKPIVFYVDPGAPAQIRDALIEGASWWSVGFEAAGFEDAFRVELLPDDAHPLDIRYNVINWVHRQTRGWSYGGSVSDPRTGEILKANVILGSQRVRQDRMIFEGLAGVANTGTGHADDPIEISLARIRQLSAHEVGHTLGFAHNFAASSNDRASVMDYPAPYIRPHVDGTLDFSEAYASGLGVWDIFTVKWLYSEFPEASDEDGQLDTLVAEAATSGLRFIADQHSRSGATAHPYGSVWDNGDDAIETLQETLRVREIALKDFGLDRLAEGRPTSDLNTVIVPIYLYHRYQVAAAAKYIGGLEFSYGVNGANPGPGIPVPVEDQQRALSVILDTLNPNRLDLPDHVLNFLTPGDVGFAGGGQSLEVFPSRTGPVFDLATSAAIATDLSFNALLAPQRLERLTAFEQRSESAFSLSHMLAQIDEAVFAATGTSRHEALARTIQSRFIEHLISTSSNPDVSFEVASKIDVRLTTIRDRLSRRRAARSEQQKQHFRALASRINQYFDAGGVNVERLELSPPPGSPIGSASVEEQCWFCD